MDINLEIFRPREYWASIYQIDYGRLKSRGFSAILMDLDETLLPREMRDITPVLFAFIEGLKDKGFKLCLLSNSLHPERVEYVGRTLKIPYITLSAKPLPFAFERALKILGATKAKTVVIGDQLFMDTLGGNWVGLYTILVKPMSRDTFWLRRWMRWGERWVLRQLNLEA